MLLWYVTLMGSIYPYTSGLPHCHWDNLSLPTDTWVITWSPSAGEVNLKDMGIIDWYLTHWGRDKMAANFADYTFNRIFFNENARISIKFSLKFVPKGPINNILALVQIMAWHRPGEKPSSEPVMVSLLTHICVTRPQWVKHNEVQTKSIILGIFLVYLRSVKLKIIFTSIFFNQHIQS